MISVTGIILSGGESKRMGTDKAFVIYRNKKLIVHTIDLFKSLFTEILISANSDFYNQFGYTVIKDEIQGCGPIGGISSCLKNSNNEWAFVSGCDTPFINQELFNRLIGFIGDYHCIVPYHSGKKEPLVALYNKNSLSVFEENMKHKNYKMHFLLEKLNCNYVNVSDLVDIYPFLFSNFNLPTDLNKLIQ